MKRLLDERSAKVREYFSDQDRKGVKSRFDRSKAPLVMEILERQLFHPGWIQYGSRVLDSVKEESESDRKAILAAVFADSRDVVAAKVGKGEWPAVALRAYDFVYDVFENPLGPNGDGHSHEKGLPVRWTEESISWKTPLPGFGQSSPVLWGDRIFLTAALDKGRQRIVFCVDR